MQDEKEFFEMLESKPDLGKELEVVEMLTYPQIAGMEVTIDNVYRVARSLEAIAFHDGAASPTSDSLNRLFPVPERRLF